MTNERMQDLNVFTLIGCTLQRGKAWHFRDDLQGAEGNHYEGFIPVGDVVRRLFDWQPVKAPVAYLVPLGVDEATSDPIVLINGTHHRVIQTSQERVGVLRSDNDFDLGVFKDGVVHPPYTETLIREAEKLTGSTLGISSAGLLSRGGRAWVEFSLPETIHDPKSGLNYRPNLLKADSMDGTIALTTALTVNATVCDNTLRWNLLEATEAGRVFKRKHTSLFKASLDDERAALGLLEAVDETFKAGLHELLSIELTPKQRIEVMDIIVPVPEEDGRGKTMAENKRERLASLDFDVRVEPWVGTGWGEFQRFNTDDHWLAPVKGTGRAERNTWRSLNGKRQQFDADVVKAIQLVAAS